MNKKLFLIIAVISVFIAIFIMNPNNKLENYEILFNWGTSENINDPKEVEKVLMIFGDIDFKKLDQLQSSTDKYINWFEPFYNYENHTFKTIENIFRARQKSDENLSDNIDKLILSLYRKTDTKLLVQSIVNSKTEYKEIFDTINNIIFYTKRENFYGNVDHNNDFIVIGNIPHGDLYIFNNQNLDNIFNFSINKSRNNLTSFILYNDSKILYTNKNYINNKCELYQLDIITKENKLLHEFNQNFGLLAYENGIVYVKKSKWSENDKGKKDYNIYSLNLNDYKFNKIIEFVDRIHLLDIKNDWLLYTSDDINLYGLNMYSNEKRLIYKFKDSEYIMKAVFKDNKTILAQIAYQSYSKDKREILTIDENGKITLIDESYNHLLVDEISDGYVYKNFYGSLYFKII